MNNLSLRIEPFAGAVIHDCCREAMRLANALQIIVMFKFNGVDCMARPGDDPTDLVTAWDMELRGTHSHKLACASQIKSGS